MLGFPIYLLMLSWFLFISVDSINRSSYFKSREIHIIPFVATYTAFANLNNNTYNISEHEKIYYHLLVIRNIVGNTILFIPWGFLIPYLFGRYWSVWKMALLTLLVCIFIESIQYVFVLGVADIDDVIYNVGGALIGFHLLQVVKQYFSKHTTPDTLN